MQEKNQSKILGAKSLIRRIYLISLLDLGLKMKMEKPIKLERERESYYKQPINIIVAFVKDYF